MIDHPTGVLLTGARVYTADPHFPWAQAVLVQGNRIAYVGTEEEARARGPKAERIHVPGGLVVPGLNESHVHMTMGSEALTILNLEGVRTLADLQNRLRTYASENPHRPWIEAYGLAYEPLSGLDRPEREALDEAIGDRPVFIRAMDYHSAWVNSAAIRLAGIERGAAIPPPNEVVLDARGLATGMLKERQATGCVTRLLTPPSQQQRDDMLCRAMRYMNSLGITSVQNMDGDPERLAQYQRLWERGDLTVRAYHYLNVRTPDDRILLPDFAEITRHFNDSWNCTRGIKLFVDGVVEARTALMLEPYADGTEETGVADMDLQAFHDIIVEADRLGMDVAVHAIGDRGVRLTLDAFEAARRANGSHRGRRHRVEHIEVSHAQDIPRFAQLGVTASMQPFHAAPGGDPSATPWTQLVGAERQPYAFPWRSLLEAGASLAFGSDWPVVTPDVRVGLHTALSRTNIRDEPVGGWQPQQCVTLAQALDAYTRGGAYAEAQDDVKGILRAGMLADVTVFSEDLFRLRPTEILSARIALTMVDGRIVHRDI